MSDTDQQDARPSAIGFLFAPVRAGDPIRWGLPHAAIAYSVGIVFGAVLFNLLSEPGRPASATTTFVSTAGLWFGFFGGSWGATRWFGRRSLRDDFGFVLRPVDVLFGLAAGPVTQLVVVPLASWPVERLWRVDVSTPNEQLLSSRGSAWLLYAGVIVLAPIAEEVFFRGLVLRSLARRYTDRVAVVVSAALFAATHFKPAQFPALFAVGVVFAALATHHRRLGPAIVAHMAFNATAVLILR